MIDGYVRIDDKNKYINILNKYYHYQLVKQANCRKIIKEYKDTHKGIKRFFADMPGEKYQQYLKACYDNSYINLYDIKDRIQTLSNIDENEIYFTIDEINRFNGYSKTIEGENNSDSKGIN